MALNRHQASGAYRRWDFPSFDAPPPEALAPPPGEPPPDAAVTATAPAPDPSEPPPVEASPAEAALPLPEPDIQLPTAEDIERIHEEARKEGYAAGYEEATARGRMEAMRLHGLVEGLEAAMSRLDADVAEEVLALSLEVARLRVRQTLATRPESVVDLIREALVQLPQAHAQIHLNPEDLGMVRDYLGELLTHAGHRLVEDSGVARGGARIEGGGSQVDATVPTRWRRIMDNLGRNIPWEGEG